jgi:hypothetical protein
LPLAGQGTSRNELELGTDVAKVNSDAEIRLLLSTTDQVQGLQFVFDWPAGAGTGVSLMPGPAIASADTVVQRVEDTYMVLGVVMDSDGEGGEVISPGDDQHVATAVIRTGTTLGGVDITFRDGMYATVDGGPLLDNIVVVGGLSIGGTEGLIQTPGGFEVVEGFNRFYFGPNAGTTAGQQTGTAQAFMENLAPVEGLVMAVCHETSDLTLQSIALGAAVDSPSEADFTQTDVFPGGGTIGLVTDLLEPFLNNTIPAGEANHIANFTYRCNTVPPAGQNLVSDLTFCDMQLGDPLKENVIVVGGLSVGEAQGLQLEDGTFTCRGGAPPVLVEICDNGIDDDDNGLIDLEDPACQRAIACGRRQQDPATGNPLGPVQGPQGGTAEVCTFIKTPEDDGASQTDHVQGFSMGIAFCCDILQAREHFNIEGTIIQALGAEFVSIQVDNGMGTGPLQDDDPECEIVIGVLLDSLPPFEGQTIPPSPIYQRVGCITFDVLQTADCGECCPIDFRDGVMGRGKVPIKNLLSTENKSVSPLLVDCQVCVEDEEEFFRGDCNFMSTLGMPVDIADAAAVISSVFPIDEFWEFDPPCPDACDCNDDGRLDLADAICILQFLFGQGNRPPRPPGFDQTTSQMTSPGPDPTPDKLDCPASRVCGA